MLCKKTLTLIGFCLFSTLNIFSQNKPYKAGEVYTENIYNYGKMEVRMLAATGSGVISNFFTFKEGSELASTFWEEIDIEVFGKDGANSWQTNLITGQGNSNLTRTEGVHFDNGLGQEYHTYTIEWRPDSVTWLIDGEITRTINGGQSLLVDEDTSLRFNIWNPNIPEWVGSFNSNILPVSMFVNWIKFYPWNGSSFDTTPSLEDNFNSFNTNTWTKANHTFAENQSDFIPENVNVVNGYLVLTITNANETGYSGNPPIDDDENTPPVEEGVFAIINTSATSGTAPFEVVFDGSTSYDINGGSINYNWDFGDGTNANTEIVTHTYEDPGVYEALLTVTNNDGLTSTNSVTISVQSDDDGTTEDCNFNTPISEPLSTNNKSYTNVFTVGEGAPNLDNITNFTINWDLANNGLWQLSFNTNNGVPNWWMDLRGVSTQNFSQSEPQITFENTNIAGLDGTYDVNFIGDDFVMVSQDSNFSIYFSYSGSEPNCDTSAKNIHPNLTVSIYPNPSDASFNLSSSTNITKIEIFDVSGRIIETVINQKLSIINFGEELTTGIYFVKTYSKTDLPFRQFKLIKK